MLTSPARRGRARATAAATRTDSILAASRRDRLQPQPPDDWHKNDLKSSVYLLKKNKQTKNKTKPGRQEKKKEKKREEKKTKENERKEKKKEKLNLKIWYRTKQ